MKFFATPPVHGSLANQVVHPADLCFKLPDNVSLEEGAMCEPLSVGVHGCRQHARLKLLHTGKDRAISRMIGKEWNKLTESEKAVYQERAVIDKARYKREMEHYREGLKKEQAITNATPLQQQYFMMDTNMQSNGGNSHQINENEPTSEYYDDDNSSSFEGEEKTTGNDSNLETVAENVNTETVAGG